MISTLFKIKISLKLLYSRTETVEGRISELEDMSLRLSGQRSKETKNKKRRRRRREIKRWGKERIFEGIMAISFSN